MRIGAFTGPYAAWPALVLNDLAAAMAADDLLADDPDFLVWPQLNNGTLSV